MAVISRMHASAAALERALGDPAEPGPLSFRRLLEHDEREEAPETAFEMLRAWGLQAHLVPTSWGGRLTSFDELLSLVRVVSRRDLTLTTGLGSTLLAAVPVWAWGSDERRVELAELLLRSRAFGCFAVSERDAGSDFNATTTRAAQTENGYVLDGEKWLIGNASRCEFVVTLARTQPALSLLFVRPNHAPRGTCRRLPRIRTLGLRGHDLGGIAFDRCPLPPEAIVGTPGRGMEMTLTTLQFTRTMIAGMALGAADTALRLALGWGRSRHLYGRPIIAMPAVRSLLLGAFLDILIGECVAVVGARALTMAPRRASLWAAATKYLVPNLAERAVRDASIVLSARSYLREGVADGIFQKISRDVAITSIFEGTQLVQLSLIASQLHQLFALGRSASPAVDIDRLCNLATPATTWDPTRTELRLGDPGGDELVERWFRHGDMDGGVHGVDAGSRAAAAIEVLRGQADALWPALAARSALDLTLARRYCTLHAAACCLHLWHCSRELMAPEATGGAWLGLCLERLAQPGEPTSSEDPDSTVVAWMLRQLDAGELFSTTPLELAG